MRVCTRACVPQGWARTEPQLDPARCRKPRSPQNGAEGLPRTAGGARCQAGAGSPERGVRARRGGGFNPARAAGSRGVGHFPPKLEDARDALESCTGGLEETSRRWRVAVRAAVEGGRSSGLRSASAPAASSREGPALGRPARLCPRATHTLLRRDPNGRPSPRVPSLREPARVSATATRRGQGQSRARGA